MHSTGLGLLYVSEKRKKDIVPTICLAAIFLKQGRKVRGKPHFPQKNWSKHIFQRCLKSLLMLQMLRKTDLCKQPSLLPSGHRPGQESINSHVVCSYDWNWDAQNPLQFHFLKRLNVDEWFFPIWFCRPSGAAGSVRAHQLCAPACLLIQNWLLSNSFFFFVSGYPNILSELHQLTLRDTDF